MAVKAVNDGGEFDGDIKPGSPVVSLSGVWRPAFGTWVFVWVRGRESVTLLGCGIATVCLLVLCLRAYGSWRNVPALPSGTRAGSSRRIGVSSQNPLA